jgi:predicted membrane protein
MEYFYFPGLFLLVSCAVLLIRAVAGIAFPVVKVIAFTFVILLALKPAQVNFPWPGSFGHKGVFFRSLDIDSSGKLFDGYQIVFSRTTFDLDGMEKSGEITDLSINNFFSGNTIYLPPDIPVNIRVYAVFAGVKMPGRNSPMFGRGTYMSGDFDPGKPHMNINVNVLFGNIVFMRKS